MSPTACRGGIKAISGYYRAPVVGAGWRIYKDSSDITDHARVHTMRILAALAAGMPIYIAGAAPVSLFFFLTAITCCSAPAPMPSSQPA